MSAERNTDLSDMAVTGLGNALRSVEGRAFLGVLLRDLRFHDGPVPEPESGAQIVGHVWFDRMAAVDAHNALLLFEEEFLGGGANG